MSPVWCSRAARSRGERKRRPCWPPPSRRDPEPSSSRSPTGLRAELVCPVHQPGPEHVFDLSILTLLRPQLILGVQDLVGLPPQFIQVIPPRIGQIVVHVGASRLTLFVCSFRGVRRPSARRTDEQTNKLADTEHLLGTAAGALDRAAGPPGAVQRVQGRVDADRKSVV